ncbi:exodeoxyribonuclease III, partial [Bacillus sp. mrc49]
MKLVSWNVNGIRACVKKGFLDYFKEVDADIFCLQETKLQEGQISLELDGYHQYWNYALKKGYSGTAIFTKEKPLSVKYGVGDLTEEPEGRIITLEYEKFYMVNVYAPNA